MRLRLLPCSRSCARHRNRRAVRLQQPLKGAGLNRSRRSGDSHRSRRTACGMPRSANSRDTRSRSHPRPRPRPRRRPQDRSCQLAHCFGRQRLPSPRHSRRPRPRRHCRCLPREWRRRFLPLTLSPRPLSCRPRCRLLLPQQRFPPHSPRSPRSLPAHLRLCPPRRLRRRPRSRSPRGAPPQALDRYFRSLVEPSSFPLRPAAIAALEWAPKGRAKQAPPGLRDLGSIARAYLTDSSRRPAPECTPVP